MSTVKDISNLVKKIRQSDRPSCTWIEKEEVIKIIMDHFNISRDTTNLC